MCLKVWMLAKQGMCLCVCVQLWSARHTPTTDGERLCNSSLVFVECFQPSGSRPTAARLFNITAGLAGVIGLLAFWHKSTPTTAFLYVAIRRSKHFSGCSKVHLNLHKVSRSRESWFWVISITESLTLSTVQGVCFYRLAWCQLDASQQYETTLF